MLSNFDKVMERQNFIILFFSFILVWKCYRNVFGFFFPPPQDQREGDVKEQTPGFIHATALGALKWRGERRKYSGKPQIREENHRWIYF